MKQERIRLFVAIPLNSYERELVERQCNHLQMIYSFQKWTYSMDYHVTLKFLGEVPLAKVQQIQDLLFNIAEETAPFTLELDNLGTFGPKASPSILWAGIGGDKESLVKLQSNVETTLNSLGFVNENRPFHPHITLARKFERKIPSNISFLNMEQLQIEKGNHPWSVNEMVLYESHVQRKPMYEAIERIRFRKQATAR